jgi:hypothetical protein
MLVAKKLWTKLWLLAVLCTLPWTPTAGADGSRNPTGTWTAEEEGGDLTAVSCDGDDDGWLAPAQYTQCGDWS